MPSHVLESQKGREKGHPSPEPPPPPPSRAGPSRKSLREKLIFVKGKDLGVIFGPQTLGSDPPPLAPRSKTSLARPSPPSPHHLLFVFHRWVSAVSKPSAQE